MKTKDMINLIKYFEFKKAINGSLINDEIFIDSIRI